MLRKLMIGLFLVGLMVGNVAAQEKSYSAQRFDVDVVVEEGGSLRVTETVTFDFAGGPFTFVFRELETALSDGVRDVRAAVDGRPLPEGDQPGQVEISGDDPVRVEWHLEPFSDGTRTFTLDYRMLGVVRQQEAYDLLLYQPLPDEHEYTIDSSTIAFTYPATAQLSGDPVVTTDNGQVQHDGNRIVVSAQNLSPDETLIVESRFAPGTLIAGAPAWQQQQMEQRAALPYWIAAAVAILVVGLALLAVLYRRNQPSVKARPHTVYEPPSGLPPAMAGAINGAGAKPAWANALGTLFDLANRGVLRIKEVPAKGWFRDKDFAIEIKQEPVDLQPHERGLLTLLFETGEERTETVKLSELSKRVSSRQWKKYADPLSAELERTGFISQERATARGRLTAAGVMLIFLAFALFIAFALLDMLGGLAIAASFFLLGLITALMGHALSPLTDDGQVLANEWQQFADHLKDVTKGKAAISGPEMFQRFLPFAASYGLLESWAKRFQKEGWTELPPYFHALSQADEASVAAFVAMTAASGASGGSAAGAAGAAGAGAAGGGASGAG